MSRLSPLVLERLMLYHRFITTGWSPDDPGAVTSAEIAGALDVDATQVRKDFGAIGVRGKGRVGYNEAEAVSAIRRTLGFDRTHLAVLVGAGHLGGALMAYRNFPRHGLRIVAAFDDDEGKVGDELGGCPILAMDELHEYVGHFGIRLGIITVPADAAQDVSDSLVAAGIDAIWNFAPIRLAVPTAVCLRNEHLSLGFAQIAYHLTHPAPLPAGD